ncbi:MAG: hypothetical protein FD163_751 [Hyphomonadaceae bacterium]|nr:MAG: hypothetical protein FD128_1501 [Hyphomonadaceae bacterium]KAF0186083.1 MAG: hypothetical protein FD163_751 [Hyphomonadaceae bacterium]
MRELIKKMAAAIIFCSFLLSGEAIAQEFRTKSRPRSQTDAMEALLFEFTAKSAVAIRDGNAQGAFRQLIEVSTGNRENDIEIKAVLRNDYSGLSCVFAKEDKISVQISHRDERGNPDGVSCTVENRNGTFSFYAQRYGELNVETELAKAREEIRALHPNLREVETPINRASNNVPSYDNVATNTQSASFEFQENFRQQIESVFVTQREGWLLHLRHKGPKSRGLAASSAWYSFLAAR